VTINSETWGKPRPSLKEIGSLAARAAEVLHQESSFPCLILCEHAGFDVPKPWRSLGLPAGVLASHFGGDIGADALARSIARQFRVPTIIARYSRLFLDYNRYPGDWSCTRPDAGGIPIPGNQGITPRELAMRETIARLPLKALIENDVKSRHAVISIHTFTPVFDGVSRPWDFGLQWKRDDRLARGLHRPLAAMLPDANIGFNVPYDWHRMKSFTLEYHAKRRHLPCLFVEVRNDLLTTPRRVQRIAGALGRAIMTAVENSLQAPSDRDS
jgi:predicted N-formylglutamate amidohydrolase